MEIDNTGHLFKQVKITCVYAYGQKQETCNIFMTQQGKWPGLRRPQICVGVCFRQSQQKSVTTLANMIHNNVR